jgi:2'-5' RNA ligase
MARRFFTVPLGAKPSLVEAQNYMRSQLPPDSDFQDPNTFHITLLVVEDDKGADLSGFNVAADLPPFGAVGQGFWSFETPDNGYAVHMEVDGGIALRYLQAALYYKAQSAGLKVSPTSYPGRWRPHVTLARSRRDPGYVRSLDSVGMEITRYNLNAENYVQVAEWPLNGTVSVQELEKRLKAMTLTENGSMTCNPGDLVMWGKKRGKVASIDETGDEPMASVQPMRKKDNLWSPYGKIEEQPVKMLSSWKDDLPDEEVEMETLASSEHLQYVIVELASKAPNIPIPTDVDTAALKLALVVDKLVFAKLPIGRVDITSRNNRTYGKEAIASLVRQVNENRPEGRWGHENDDKPPAVRWLAATLEKSGLAWGLAVALTEEAQKHFLAANATNGKVGTSIFADETVFDATNKVVDYRLIGIDLANLHGMVGVPDTAAVPVTSQETIVNLNVEEANPMTEVSDVRINELTEERGRLKGEIDTMSAELKKFKAEAEDFIAVRELLGIVEGADPVKATRQMVEEFAAMKAEAQTLLETSMSAMIAEKIGVEAVRPIVIEMVQAQKPATRKALDRAVDDVIARESVKALLAAHVAAAAGPAQGNSSTAANSGNQGKGLINIPSREATK